MKKTTKLLEVASVFFKMGCVAFGGPAAHIALMESEIVSKRKWISDTHFLDLIGATNLIPGPNSTEMTMHCGHERAGALGLFVAGICFIFPATVITLIFAWFYETYGELPEVAPFITGIKPAILAIILGAIIKLGKKAWKNWEFIIFGIIAFIACLLGVSEILALLGTGILGFIFYGLKQLKGKSFSVIFPLLATNFTTPAIAKLSSYAIFWKFLKVGAILYGSGYVLFAYLDAALVAKGLLSRSVLMDAIAVGQFTPGPVLSTATFIGYQLGGVSGAVMASIGIFLPSFLFVWLLNPLIPKMRNSKILGYFLSVVNSAAVAVMVSVLFKMGKEILIDWKAALILVLALIITFKFKQISAFWVVIGGALLGYLLTLA